MICLYAFFDGLQYLASGAIRATGQQGVAALFTWFSYALVALTLSCVLTIKTDLGLLGTWIGPVIALVLNFCAYIFIWNRLDFDKIIAESADQRDKDKGSTIADSDDFKRAED